MEEQIRQEQQMLDFVQIYGLQGVFVICVNESGEGAKVSPEVLTSTLTANMKPSINADGYWLIGSAETGVIARAQTPILTANGSVLLWRYDGESEDMNRVIADLRNFVFKLEDLTPAERESLSLTFDKLKPEEIAELQQPARDMIARLEATDSTASANEQTRQSNEVIRQRQEAVRVAQEQTRQTDTANAINETNAARDKALEVAGNATYIGTDMYVYEYDLSTHSYNKTQKMMKVSFKIDRTFGSVAELQANQPTGQMDGQFAIISSDTEDEDNAKLYTSKDGKWVYLTDMSGFRGFRGYTPQLSIGKVTIGDNRSDAAVSLSADGNDEEGNPKYNINLRIPSYSSSDMTAEDVTLFQKPATDKANELQALSEEMRVQTDLAIEINEHPQKQGENGNWWKWNVVTKQYEDTGIIARGGAMYPSFVHEGNRLYMVDYGSSHIEERVKRQGNALVLLF